MIKKITIVGNSVALRKRPPVSLPFNHTYGELLEKRLNSSYQESFIINNLGKQRNHLRTILGNLDTFVQTFPEYFILNIGIVEATTRDIPMWISDIKDLQEKQFKPFSQIVNFLHLHLVKPHRSTFVKLRGKRGWYSSKAFEKYYDLLISRLKKETNATIVLLPINGPSKRLEALAPGTSRNIEKFNAIINSLGARHHISVVNTEALDEKKHFPDGVHYSRDGHMEVAKQLFDIISPDTHE